MATSISSLTYKIIADTTSFDKGITATKSEIRAAKKVMEETQTPTQKYKTSLEGLNKLADKFKWSEEQKTAALKKMNAEMGVTGERLGGMTSKVTAWVAGFGTLAAGVRVVGDAFRFVAEETQSAISTMENLDDQRKRIAQVSGGPQDTAAMERLANQMALDTGINRASALDIVFSGRSEGFGTKVQQKIAKFSAPGGVIDDVGAAIKAGGQVPGLFKGSGMTPLESLNMIQVAAASSRAGFGDIASSMPRAAAGAAMQGASPEETFGLMSVLAGKYATPKEAATGIATIGSKLAMDPRYKGTSIMGGVQTLVEGGAAAQTDFIKENKELATVFRHITQNMPEIYSMIGAADAGRRGAGTSGSVLELALADRLDPRFPGGRRDLGLREMNRARARKEIEEETALAAGGAMMEAGILETQAALHPAGFTGLERSLGAKAGGAARMVGAGRGMARSAVTAGAMYPRVLGGVLAKQATAGVTPGIDMGFAGQGVMNLLEQLLGESKKQTAAMDAPEVVEEDQVNLPP